MSPVPHPGEKLRERRSFNRERDSSHQPRSSPPLSRRGVGAGGVQGVVGSGQNRTPGAPDDLCVCERLSQPERRLRRHRGRGTGGASPPASGRPVRRGDRGRTAMDSRPLQPSRSSLPPCTVARIDRRSTRPGGVGAGERDATSSRPGIARVRANQDLAGGQRSPAPAVRLATPISQRSPDTPGARGPTRCFARTPCLGVAGVGAHPQLVEGPGAGSRGCLSQSNRAPARRAKVRTGAGQHSKRPTTRERDSDA